jgi:hypothetical protein
VSALHFVLVAVRHGTDGWSCVGWEQVLDFVLIDRNNTLNSLS